jgi:hypothetical protein
MALRKVGPVGFQSLKTYPADAQILRGYGVKVGAVEGSCAQVAVAGARGIGIAAETTANAGDPASVVRHGDAVAIAGSAATQGQYAKFNAAGQVIPVTGTAGGGEEIIGRFESNPTQAGDECVIFVNPSIL